MLTIEKIRETIENKPARSAWKRGVKVYALELLESLEEGINGGYIDPADLESPALLKRPCLTARQTGANTAGAAAPSSMMEILPSGFAPRPNSNASAAETSSQTAKKHSLMYKRGRSIRRPVDHQRGASLTRPPGEWRK